MTSKVNVNVRNEAALVAKLRGQALARLDKRATVIGEQMEREYRRIVSEEFNQGDPAHRKPGPHLINMVEAVKTQTPQGIEVHLQGTRSANKKKLAALEYGAKSDYTIEPTGRVSRAQARAGLRFGLPVRPVALLRFPDPLNPGEDAYAPKVTHKAFAGKHMMRRARDIVVARLRGSKV